MPLLAPVTTATLLDRSKPCNTSSAVDDPSNLYRGVDDASCVAVDSHSLANASLGSVNVSKPAFSFLKETLPSSPTRLLQPKGKSVAKKRKTVMLVIVSNHGVACG